MLSAAATAVLAGALLSTAALGAQLPFKQVCAAPPPGAAACLSERLLIAPGSTASRAIAGSASQAINASKPFPGYLTPERLHAAYALPAETAAGSTQTIAVVDAFNDPTAEADLAVYDKQFGLPECTSENGCFRKVNQQGSVSPLPKDEGGWATEISIDVQMAHATCQSCSILLVEANSEQFTDLGAAVNAAANAGATEISNSYGGTELSSYTALNSSSYNHPGVVLTVSSGDCGYLNGACPQNTTGANFPADSPNVVAVGGTTLSEVSGVWSSSAWSEGGSGCSTVFSEAAWQAEVPAFSATGCGSGRAIADVSAVGDPNTGVDVYDSTPEIPGGPTGWGVWGGTSVSAPIVAAEYGLAGGALGVAYPASTLYSHFGQASALHDVVSGSNGSCGTATICKAVAGFDGPTGLGSPIGLEAFSIPGTPKNTSAPTISGYPEQNHTLTESHGAWTGSPTSYSYQWERCGITGAGCHPIASATAQSYLLGAADAGITVRVRETAHNATGPGSADSARTEQVLSDVPTITGFTPPSGITGAVVTITGTALDTTAQLTIGKLPASFTVLSPMKLEATVPDGASRGKISLTSAHGSATAAGKFTPTFTIKSFKPAIGAAGTLVTVKGVGFTPSSTVRFNGTPAASVSFVSSAKLKATVPAGAGSGPITVTNTAAPAGTVRSAGSFLP
ncbi:MAG: IPT/TIG domain-containing protein [Solirubrobacterales bacterium]